MAGSSENPYQPPTLNNYNSGPPTNDGQQNPGNKVTWDFHLDNIGNPLVDYSGDIDTQVFNAFAKTFNLDANVYSSVGGAVGYDLATAVLVGGVVTAFKSNLQIDTQGAAADDDMDTLTVANSTEGATFYMKSVDAARVVTLKNGTGNLFTANGVDIVLDPLHNVVFMKRGANYYQIQPFGNVDLGTFSLVSTEDRNINFLPDGTGWVTFNAAIVDQPSLLNYGEKVNALDSAAGGTISIDFIDGNVVETTITLATTFTFDNPPLTGFAGSLTVKVTNGAIGVTWPTVEWTDGTEPVLTSGLDVISFLTTDGGLTYQGFTSGQNMS